MAKGGIVQSVGSRPQPATKWLSGYSREIYWDTEVRQSVRADVGAERTHTRKLLHTGLSDSDQYTRHFFNSCKFPVTHSFIVPLLSFSTISKHALIGKQHGQENRQTPTMTTVQSTWPTCVCTVQENVKVHCVGFWQSRWEILFTHHLSLFTLSYMLDHVIIYVHLCVCVMSQFTSKHLSKWKQTYSHKSVAYLIFIMLWVWILFDCLSLCSEPPSRTL